MLQATRPRPRPRKTRRRAIAVLLLIALAVSAYLIATNRRAPEPIQLEGGMSIPYMSQLDYGATICTIGGVRKSVRTSGCGAACASMIIRYMTGNENQTPETLFEWAYQNNFYNGNGLSHDCLTQMLSVYGIEGTWIENDEEAIRSALSRMEPIIAHVGPGVFTEEGHYIVLRGVDEQGNILVNDPSSLERSLRSYELDLIISQARTPGSFMVCSPI